MKIDFTINCKNPAVVWAIKEALEARGFHVRGCGFMVATGEPDIECDPPIDFADDVPGIALEIAAGTFEPPGIADVVEAPYDPSTATGAPSKPH